MPLPSARNRTYTGASSIVPGDLDDIQDCIIGAKHGDVTMILSPVSVVFFSGTGTYGQAPTRAVSTSGCVMLREIPVLQGHRLKSVTFARKGDGAVDVTACDVVKTTAAGVDASVNPGGVTVTINNVAAAWNDTTIDVTDTDVGAGESFSLQVQPNATGFQLGSIRVTYARL